jgi:glycosyltransferase involved in cell wall biosynthesis
MKTPKASNGMGADGTTGRSIAALGDVMDPNCFGGAPWQLLQESRRQGFARHGWSVDIRRLRVPRIRWNATQLLKGRASRGFQFSEACRRAALAQIPPDILGTEVISFHQNFPAPGQVARAGGQVSYYLDATYSQLFPAYGYDRYLDRQKMRDAVAYEREVFADARRVIANQSWAFRSLLSDYGLNPEKCSMILPGANYPVYPGLRPLRSEGRAGRDRPFVMGFIGKDWRRKGLLFLGEVGARLRSRGWKVKVRAIGFHLKQAPRGAGIECLGFIDKRLQFGPFLHSCDVGCLFSSAEAAGTAVLEFLGVGIPVAGFTVNGLADLLPTEAGFRFPPTAKPDNVADVFDAYLRDEELQERYRAAARRLAPLVSWERCVREFRELWETGAVASPFRLTKEEVRA